MKFHVKKYPVRKIITAINLALASVSQVAMAEHLSLEQIEVTAKQGSSTQTNLTIAREEISNTAGAVNIIDAEQIREGRVANFNDSLGMASGVYVQSRFGSEESKLSIRGSGLQRNFHGLGLKLMQDGIPVNLADGSFDFVSIEPLATQYTTVYRGANALEFGASNLGGAINFISQTGYTAPKFEVRSEFGSFGYQRLGLSTGGVEGNLDYFLSGTLSNSDGYRDNAEQSAERITANVGYKLNPNLETRFYLGYVNKDSELPSSLTKRELKDNPTQSNVNLSDGVNRRDVDLWRIANKTTFNWDSNTLELGAYYVNKTLYHPIVDLNFLLGFGVPPAFVPTLGVLDQHTDDYGLTAKLTHEGHLFGHANTIIAGVSPTYGINDDKRYRNVNQKRGTKTNQFDQSAKNIETFIEDRLHVTPKLQVIAGLQYAHATREQKDEFIEAGHGDESYDVSYNQTSPKLGLLYQWQPQVQLFTNVSRSFEPPSFGDLSGGFNRSILKEQKGTTFEIGSRGNSEHIDWDVAIYHAKIDNELLQVSPFSAGTTINADKTTHTGLEFGMTARLPLSLEWRHSLLINDFRFDGDAQFGNGRISGIQKSLLRAELLYRGNHLLNGFYFGPTFEVSPQRYAVDFAETLYVDSYTLLGLKTGQKVNEHWSWFLEGRNLTNKKYAAANNVVQNASGDPSQFYPGEGRAAYAGVTWRY